MRVPYIGRFAPSPTGTLHAGSLVAALASWLDARAHGGQWLVRIEDVDTPRCVPGADRAILQQLATCGLLPDAEPVWQSQRGALYAQALEQLVAAQLAYPCACSRKDIEVALQSAGQHKPRHGELVYPGTCREGLQGRAARAWRLHTGRCAALPASGHKEKKPLALMEQAQAATESIACSAHSLCWSDRRLGAQAQDVEHAVGDFVLRRSDGLWAYQLAVVVDDAAQGITHVVRGADLLDNTPRQLLLQRALGLPHPVYLHTPLVLGANGEKLSKQNGAAPLVLDSPAAVLAALNAAAIALGLPPHPGPVAEALGVWVSVWTRARVRAWPHAAP